jgi:GDP-mannose transporter
MDDKKNEDYAIKMPEHEMRSFNTSPAQRESFNSSRSGSSKIPALSNITNSPPISILAYCLASISMTVTNKYCVSGANWNLNFFYLAVQVHPRTFVQPKVSETC